MASIGWEKTGRRWRVFWQAIGVLIMGTGIGSVRAFERLVGLCGSIWMGCRRQDASPWVGSTVRQVL
jgi:hypothetical protein